MEEEPDESIYSLALLVESGLIPEVQVDVVKKEVNELLAMTVASIKTLHLRKQPGETAAAIQNLKSKI